MTTAARELEDLPGGALLEEFDVLHATQRRAEARTLVVAVQWAHQNGPGTVDPELARLPGRQRSVRSGGRGTPEVAEFAASAMGARLELSPYAGQRLLADALDLCYRLPRLWQRLQRLEVRAGHARFVARRTREMTAEQADYVDSRVVEAADGRLSWTRFESLVEASIVAADVAAARAREAEAAERQFAKATGSDEHGLRGFFVRADFATIARIDATVAYLAEALAALGDPGSVDQRRVKAVLMMANPAQAVRLLQAVAAWRRRPEATSDGSGVEPERFRPGAESGCVLDEAAMLPLVHLFVHVLGRSTGAGEGAVVTGMGAVARVEGRRGVPVTAQWVGQHLGPRCRFTITPALDPLGQLPVDAYEIPLRHRNAVRILSPADCFPYAANTDASAMQIDHTVAFDHRAGAPPGQSRIGNYGPMVGFHHRLKTHGSWQVQQPFPGVFVWRDAHGATYLVDHTGTRRINRPPDASTSLHDLAVDYRCSA